uniref:LRR receptor-like serine/threonine-protein kinase GSO2 n=1 Tax=Cajanus cajan TaxID=3821 RepID=A0A151S2W5_CAJCA|nr:LRR receptor-like serine/threonine-protein kinase GSO2 [Cajanus cajan]
MIPTFLYNQHELRMLDIGPNSMKGRFPNWLLENNTKLDFLNLSNNHLIASLGDMRQLNNLDLSHNNLFGHIPQEFGKDLRYLYLQNNKFSGPIPTFLTNSSFLLTMNLVDNKFSGQIPWWISSLLNLRILLLKKNKLDGLIPIDVCQLKNISIMDLSQNNFSRSIPPCLNNISFGRLDSLAAKVLGKFVVPWVTRSTEYVFWYETYKGNILDLMSGLDLSSNKLTGQIPSQMGYLNSIHTLNLSNNHLTGPMPETFSSLKQIESLDLSCNRLSGHIPSQLTDLYHLSVFSVAHNDFSGRTLERVNQFATFEASSYEGNTLLCGPPLNRSCSSVVKQPAPGIGTSPLGKNEFRDTFVYSFPPPFCVAFVSVIAFRYFNSYFKVPYKNKFCV